MLDRMERVAADVTAEERQLCLSAALITSGIWYLVSVMENLP